MHAMKTLYFVRHGEADYNLLDRVNAHPEVANNLTVTGREQAACCARTLAEYPIDMIYVSQFPRAQQTAEIINRGRNVSIATDARINETGSFAFEGQPARRWREANRPSRIVASIPDCEPFTALKARLRLFLRDLLDTPQRHLVIVSHEEPIQIMLGLVRGLADEQALATPISHCLPRIEALDKFD